METNNKRWWEPELRKEYELKFISVGEHGDRPVPPEIVWNWFCRQLREVEDKAYQKGREDVIKDNVAQEFGITQNQGEKH